MPAMYRRQRAGSLTPVELFSALADAGLPRLVEERFDRKDLCILSTRVALDVAAYFGVPVTELPVRAIAYNPAFRRRVDAGKDCLTGNPSDWGDGSWSVGIGFGFAPGQPQATRWNGHLIVVGGGYFA